MANAIMTQCVPLANGFFQIGLSKKFKEQALPGQFILVNEQPFYILSHENDINIIIPSLIKENLTVSEIMGEPYPSPDPSKFQLMTFEDDELNACLFFFKKHRAHFKGLVLIGTKSHFPFLPAPSRMIINHVPASVIGAIPLLEDWQVPNRLASLEEIPGVFHGSVNDLANYYVSNLPEIPASSIIGRVNSIVT